MKSTGLCFIIRAAITLKKKTQLGGLMVHWEHLQSDRELRYLWRAKVPGGWIVKVEWKDSVSLIFYPDTEHEWDGSSLP
jgi:hypothetical protein